MCGVVGVAGDRPIEDREWLLAGRDAMLHRGPDDAGAWWSADGCVGLGHRRLAIIDLSAGGHQPMHDANGDFAIVFNGEIYNFADLRSELVAAGHTFRSRSDTEVILEAYRAWGTDCLGHLNGQFAFALYDARRREVFIARDRAGEKPLYYAVRDGVLQFASELKALLADRTQPRRIDCEALDCYLTMGFSPGSRCIVQGISKLPPGHALVFQIRDGQARTWRYWQLPELDRATERGVDESALLDELEALLADSVRRQLVADVPVGVLLSGGVDSSLVTAFAVRASPNVKTFTIRFSNDPRYDESEHARLIARHFNTDHTELDADQPTVDVIERLAKQFDEPIVDSSMVPTYLVSRLTRQHCTVALGGDGGDELFGGYRQYNRLLWTQQKLGWLPTSASTAIARVAEALLPIGFRGRIRLQNFDADLRDGLPLVAYCFDRSTRRALLSDGRWPLAAERVWNARVPRERDIVQRATRMDFENYLAEDVLVKVDRASMLSSLEVRAPLLDHRLVEFAFSKVPSALKATTSERKIMLKRLAARVLPPEFDRQRKQGFAAPLPAWLELAPWKAFFRETLLGSRNTLTSPIVADKLLRGQDRGMMNSERLFALVMLELWRREYGLSL